MKPQEPKITMEEFTKLCAEPIDWEQRRYEIAKDVMAADVASGCNDTIKGYANYAISMANVLIKQLKEAHNE